MYINLYIARTKIQSFIKLQPEVISLSPFFTFLYFKKKKLFQEQNTEKVSFNNKSRMLFGGSQVSNTLITEKKNKKKNVIRGKRCLPIPIIDIALITFLKIRILHKLVLVDNMSLARLLCGKEKAVYILKCNNTIR